MTVRQYHRGIVDIPAGAARIDYGERYGILPECDYVFSATASPNLTLTGEKLGQCRRDRKQIFVDLAVPRDIEEKAGELPLVTLYDVDDFALRDLSPEMERGLEQAKRLIEHGMEEFLGWHECRELIPAVQRICDLTAKDLCGRLENPFRQMEPEHSGELLKAVEGSAGKATAKLLFALRDELDAESFRECLDILGRKLYGERI